MKQLIINADDIGAAEGTVEAISRLYKAGVVTSTTALVNQSDWPKAAEYLRIKPGLGAGVHLVMNDGRPVLPPEQVPSLVNVAGYFYNGKALLMRIGRLNLHQLESEWRAQIEKFIHDTGRRPDHLDLHCYYPYVFPSWFRVSLKLAREFGCLPVRLPFDNDLAGKAPLLAKDAGFPAWYVRQAGRRYQRMVAKFGLARTDYWESSFSHEGNRTADYLLHLLERLPAGDTELLCHPGIGTAWREQDFRALMDERIKKAIDQLGIRLTTYKELFQ